jgi:hypothetical protein
MFMYPAKVSKNLGAQWQICGDEGKIEYTTAY